MLYFSVREQRKQRKLELENFVCKKYKVTSETSTPASLKENNNNKIYYQHHDHSYAKNKIVNLVNDDCLAEIFTYVPACERPKIALVCQKWRRVLDYSWSNVKKLELTHWERAEYPNFLKKYPIPDGRLTFLKSLLYKCGRYLTELDLSAYGYSDIVPVINEYCSNLVKLRLRFIYDDDEIIYDKAFSRLSKLKVLTVIFQYMKYESMLDYIIHALLPLADTLTDLTLFNWKDDVPSEYTGSCKFSLITMYVLKRMKALKRFEFGGIQMYPELEEYLRSNRTLECSYYDRSLNENIIRPNQLMSITTLNLKEYKVSDDSLYTIANTMKQITTLTIKWQWITNDGVVTISKMNNLKFLIFSGVNDSINSSSIKLLKNLIRLMLPGSNIINDDLAIKVLENSPKLEALFVPDTSVTVEFIKKAAEISRIRKRILLVAVSFEIDKKQYESPYFKIICSKKKKLNN
ncbi:uncharacterized protein LOC122855830 [Aphidius gifuensis]|uniref:uncharacterized protein LOC122855830 n=1 Tax=Aphidius gifuensis TaxID=684658 RepID=UPI001CDCD671|nr:uncharacterized protein LOC122855830 [Aphidius gifuensis]